VIGVDEIRNLIRLGNENRNLDFKGAFSWSEANHDEKCAIAKDVLAFSNTRDGGVILIGVNDKSGDIEGLTDEQYASFDQTKFNSFVEKFTAPRHTSNVHRIMIDQQRIVVINIPEFADVPILCARDANSSSNQSKLLLRRAALYKRTERATSEPVEDADEMRELLNRGLLRRQDELFRAFKQIILPIGIDRTPAPGAEFKAEVGSAERYFSELEGVAFSELPHWSLMMRPEDYIAGRIPTSIELQRFIQVSAISLRGWTFPIAGRIDGSEWRNFDGGTQSFYNGMAAPPEALRAYKSGLVAWRSGMGEDHWPGFAGQEVLSFMNLIFSVTEWTLFARRFFEPLLAVDERIEFKVGAYGIKGRRLVSEGPRLPFHQKYQTEESSFEILEALGMSDLRADPEAIARRIIRKIFELFNWNDPDDAMLRGWQQKLIRRQF